MRVIADVDELINNGMKFEILSPDGSMLGVAVNISKFRTVLYKDKAEPDRLTFMQFYDQNSMDEYEQLFSKYQIKIYDSQEPIK